MTSCGYDLAGHPGSLLDAFALAAKLATGTRPVLVVCSDHQVSYDKRVADTLSAGGAAAFSVVAEGGFATLGPQARVTNEVYDVWTLGREPEPRYRLEVLADAYAKATAAIGALETATETPTASYGAVCASQPHPQTLRALGKAGVTDEQLSTTSFVGEIGNVGCASVGVALALGLDASAAGQDVLAFGYGAGEGIAQKISVTGEPPRIGAAEQRAQAVRRSRSARTTVGPRAVRPSRTRRRGTHRGQHARRGAGDRQDPAQDPPRQVAARPGRRRGAPRDGRRRRRPPGRPGALHGQRRLHRLLLRELGRPDERRSHRPRPGAGGPLRGGLRHRGLGAAPGLCGRSSRASTTPSWCSGPRR